ncbi:MAG: DUF3536 domain-containing protein [Deltaproteobacteria bacterium]|nr:DUF3536 domain-containing protein [Deltaproteobacteria bacterium]
MSHPPALIIHGHFYQPPRDNPWTGIVDREPGAAPFHDWNERIHAECYRPNAHARIHDDEGRVGDVVNNYRRISFNFGPTLVSWLKEHHPKTLRRVLTGDRHSLRERGHGNAIAQGYNHAILPLCNDRDMRTQIRWGLHEFRSRFGRDAEALWMPETACDDRTLGVLIDEGLTFALLAPGQAERIREGDQWHDVSDGSIDPRRPYRYLHRDGSGRSIALFFYDGAISQALAFEGLLGASRTLIDRFERASGGDGTLVHAVTDGETYGHHHKFGDRCLAHALKHEAQRHGFWVTNYGELLDRHPPEVEVEIKAGEDGKGTSWSCAHGVGRWFRDCGCHTGGKPGWNQRWRKPLREALDGLRDHAIQVFEDQAGELCTDPWALRDAYIELLVDPGADRERFFERQGGRALSEEQRQRALRLLEMQRCSMLMYTSCGWFFNDLAGIETVQVLRYAGRLVDQLEVLGAPGREDELLERLGEAQSNQKPKGTGADIYRSQVAPVRASDASLAAHIALSALPLDLPEKGQLAGRRYRLTDHRKAESGRLTVAAGRIELEDLATTARREFASCALFFGGVDLHCMLRPFEGEEAFKRATERLWSQLSKRSLLSLLRVAEEELGPDDYGIDNILPSSREAISRALFEERRERYAAQYETAYQDARRTIARFHEAGLPLPHELKVVAQLALAHRFDEEIARAPQHAFEPEAYSQVAAIVEEAEAYDCELRRDAACRHFETLLAHLMHRVCAGDTDVAHTGSGGPIASALELMSLAERLGLTLETDRAQEQLHRALRDGLGRSEDLAQLGAELGLSAKLFERD